MRHGFSPASLGVCLLALAGAALSAATPQPLPLVFEPNQGQWEKSIQYVGRAGDTTVLLTEREAVFVLSKATGRPPELPASQSTQVRMKLGKAAKFVPFNRQPSVSHYFIGRDPSAWRRNVPQFARVEMREVYPGIDLSFYGNQGRIEYDYIVHPGADPARIQMAYEGADSLHLNPAGDLVLSTRLGDLVQHKPFVYQLRDGRKEEVAASYRVHGMQAAVELADYDHDRDILVDPVLTYSTRFGNPNPFGLGAPIAVDLKGNLYMTAEAPFIPSPSTKSPYQTSANGYDVAILKFNNNFTQQLYAVYVGGSAEEKPSAIAVDRLGSVVVSGTTKSADFYTTPGAYQTTRQGFQDAFILRVDADGTGLTYSTYLGGGDAARGTYGFGVALDLTGKAYLTGATTSPSFPTTSGAYKTSYSAPVSGTAQDAYVASFSPTGALNYATLLGDTGDDVGVSCLAAGENGVWVTGWTKGPFPDVFGTLHPSAGGYDVFIVRVNPNGTALARSRLLGGAKDDVPQGIAQDPYGSIWVGGQTQSNDYPMVNALQPQMIVNNGAYVTKLSSNLSTIQFSTFYGSKYGGAAVSGLALDPAGNAWFTGYSFYALTTTADAFQPGPVNPGFNRDAFFAGIKNDGSALLYSTYLSGTDADYGMGLALDQNGFAYVTGYTGSTDWPTTAGPLSTANGGFFLAKFALNQVVAPNTLGGIISDKSGPANARDWTISIANGGPGTAVAAQLNSFALVQTAGAACTPVINSPLAYPVAAGNIPANTSANLHVLIDFSTCAATARFTASASFTAGSRSGSFSLFNQYR